VRHTEQQRNEFPVNLERFHLEVPTEHLNIHAIEIQFDQFAPRRFVPGVRVVGPLLITVRCCVRHITGRRETVNLLRLGVTIDNKSPFRRPAEIGKTGVLHTQGATAPLRDSLLGGGCLTRRGGLPGPRSHHSKNYRVRNSTG